MTMKKSLLLYRFPASLRTLAAILLSAALAGVCAALEDAWALSFVMFVPWLYALDQSRSLLRTLLCALGMTLGFTAAAFAWFGLAIGSYVQIGAGAGLVWLLLCAPLFQPQIIVYALVRHWLARRHSKGWVALAAASAWVGCEWLWPKLLGDTLGHALYASVLLRQAADLGGAAGLSLVLLLVNEGVHAALTRRGEGWRASLKPLVAVAVLPLLLAAYGWFQLAQQEIAAAAADKPLRVGLIQANIIDYERQRREMGSWAFTRKLLDTHFAMSYDAVMRQQADAVLWSETAYPTTFGQPKSQAGADFDRMITEIVRSAAVPFVFGTFERDAAGEYNAAAFLGADGALTGFYRKTRLFPFTEYLPGWLDQPWVRQALPWSGNWRPGNGARVFPLRLADGREIPVLPLICRDDVDPALGIAGARMGAQAIFTMSNDSWFSAWPQGARLHQNVAAFRSIETRLPQFRVTTNGYSAVIDPYGQLHGNSKLGEASIVIGDMPLPTRPFSLMVWWGDWVGPAGLLFLLAFCGLSSLQALAERFALVRTWFGMAVHVTPPTLSMPLQLTLLPPGVRVLAAGLRIVARLGLLWLGWSILQNEALRANTLAQIRTFSAICLLPELAAWALLRVFQVQGWLEQGKLVLKSGARQIEIVLAEIQTVMVWNWPWPGPGVSLRMQGTAGQTHTLACAQAQLLAQAISAAGGPQPVISAPVWLRCYGTVRHSLPGGRLDHPLAKFAVLPLLLALPAFYLHQHIAYGSGFGEYISFGWKAYLRGLGIWYGAWVIGVTLCAAALRTAIEIGTLISVFLQPQQAAQARYGLENLGKLLLYLGIPLWLVLRVYAG